MPSPASRNKALLHCATELCWINRIILCTTRRYCCSKWIGPHADDAKCDNQDPDKGRDHQQQSTNKVCPHGLWLHYVPAGIVCAKQRVITLKSGLKASDQFSIFITRRWLVVPHRNRLWSPQKQVGLITVNGCLDRLGQCLTLCWVKKLTQAIDIWIKLRIIVAGIIRAVWVISAFAVPQLLEVYFNPDRQITMNPSKSRLPARAAIRYHQLAHQRDQYRFDGTALHIKQLRWHTFELARSRQCRLVAELVHRRLPCLASHLHLCRANRPRQKLTCALQIECERWQLIIEVWASWMDRSRCLPPRLKSTSD